MCVRACVRVCVYECVTGADRNYGVGDEIGTRAPGLQGIRWTFRSAERDTETSVFARTALGYITGGRGICESPPRG